MNCWLLIYSYFHMSKRGNWCFHTHIPLFAAYYGLINIFRGKAMHDKNNLSILWNKIICWPIISLLSHFSLTPSINGDPWNWLCKTIQGVPIKMRLGFCLISRQPNIGFSNRFFLLKTEIHTLMLNTQTFVSDFWGLRYLLNKMGFLIRWFWLKLKLFDLELPHILKIIKIEIVIPSI